MSYSSSHYYLRNLNYGYLVGECFPFVCNVLKSRVHFVIIDNRIFASLKGLKTAIKSLYVRDASAPRLAGCKLALSFLLLVKLSAKKKNPITMF